MFKYVCFPFGLPYKGRNNLNIGIVAGQKSVKMNCETILTANYVNIKLG